MALAPLLAAGLDEVGVAGTKGERRPHRMRYVAAEAAAAGDGVWATMFRLCSAISSEMIALSGRPPRPCRLFRNRLPGQLANILPLKNRATTRCDHYSRSYYVGPKVSVPITGGGWIPSRSSSKPTSFKSSTDLRGLFEFFRLAGRPATVTALKKQVDYTVTGENASFAGK